MSEKYGTIKKTVKEKRVWKKLNLCLEMRARIAPEMEESPGLNVSATSATI